MLKRLVEVRRSKIEGRGVFAGVSLVADIWIPVLYRETKEITKHIIDTDEGLYDPYHPFCFLNHSDEPNAVLQWTDEGLYLVTTELIMEDTEILIDYNDGEDDEDFSL